MLRRRCNATTTGRRRAKLHCVAVGAPGNTRGTRAVSAARAGGAAPPRSIPAATFGALAASRPGVSGGPVARLPELQVHLVERVLPVQHGAGVGEDGGARESIPGSSRAAIFVAAGLLMIGISYADHGTLTASRSAAAGVRAEAIRQVEGSILRSPKEFAVVLTADLPAWTVRRQRGLAGINFGVQGTGLIGRDHVPQH